jgi:hypothetical protein
MNGIVRLDPVPVAREPQLPEGPVMRRTASLFEPGAGLTAGIWGAEPFTVHGS